MMLVLKIAAGILLAVLILVSPFTGLAIAAVIFAMWAVLKIIDAIVKAIAPSGH